MLCIVFTIFSPICFGLYSCHLQFKVNVKVNCTVVQALRLCTSRSAHRRSRGIALLFLDHGTRWGWGVSVPPSWMLSELCVWPHIWTNVFQGPECVCVRLEFYVLIGVFNDPDFVRPKLMQYLGPSWRKRVRTWEYKIRYESKCLFRIWQEISHRKNVTNLKEVTYEYTTSIIKFRKMT